MRGFLELELLTDPPGGAGTHVLVHAPDGSAALHVICLRADRRTEVALLEAWIRAGNSLSRGSKRRAG